MSELPPPIDVISLGAGIQSSTVALAAAEGLITPMPMAAVFADTMGEPAAVYRWLDRLEKMLPFPLYRVSFGDLGATIGAKRPVGKFLRTEIPAFIMGKDGKPGGLISRQCTQDYKIKPIRKQLRKLLGIAPGRPIKGHRATSWVGISLDEAHRMKPSRDEWIHVRWPLIELRWTRNDCVQWLAKRGIREGIDVHKSSCIFCPYHGRRQWDALTPEEVEKACEIDERLRLHPEKMRLKGTLYLHRSCRPLREVLAEHRAEPDEPDLFGNECYGVCNS